MATVKLPFELQVLQKEFERSILKSTASVASLDAEVNKLNEDVSRIGKAETQKNIKKADENIKIFDKSIIQTTKNVAKFVAVNFDSFSKLSLVIALLAKNFISLRNVILPLGLAIFGSTKLILKFRIETITAIIKLRIEIFKSIGLILFQFNRLKKSKSIPEFAINVQRSIERLKISFFDIKESAEVAGKALSDPNPLNDLKSNLIKTGIVLTGFNLFVKKFGGFIFGTTKPLEALGRTIALVGGSTSILTLGIQSATVSLKNMGGLIGVVGKGLEFTSKIFSNITLGVFRFGNTLGSTNSILKALDTTFLSNVSESLTKAGKNIGVFTGGLSASIKQTELFNKSLFGSVSRIAAVGVGLNLLGIILKRSENAIISFIGSVLEFIGLLIGPVGLVISKFITSLGGLIEQLGDKLVNANVKASKSFQDAELRAFTFKRTIDAFAKALPNVISGTDKWTKVINKLNKATGLTTVNLQTAVTEIVAATSEIGLNEQQMQLLLEASIDYAALVKGPVIQSALDLISAINGNSRSVQKYGLDLKATAVQQALLKDGVKATFATMTDQEKVQARLIALTDQYEKISGLAVAQIDTLAGTTKLFNSRLETLNIQYAEGANVIENFAIGQKILISVFESLNPLVVKTTGFFGAILGRVLQFGGVLLKLSFIIALVTTSYRALNTLLASEAFKKLASTTIPLVNKSFKQLLASILGTNIRLNNLKSIFLSVGNVFVVQSKRMIASILGVEGQVLTLNLALKGTLKRLKQIFIFLTGKLLLNPIVLAITAVIVAIVILFKAFKAIEKQTLALSDTFSVFNDSLDTVTQAIFGIKITFSNFFDFILKGFRQAFGVIAFIVAEKIQEIFKIISRLPDFIISFDKKIQFATAAEKLENFRKDLLFVKFDMSEMGIIAEEVSRRIASAFEPTFIAKLPEELKRLVKQLDLFGRTEIEKLEKTREARLEIIQINIDKEIITESQANEIRIKVQEQFNFKRIEIEEKARKKLADIAEKFGGVVVIRKRLNAELKEIKDANEKGFLTNLEASNAMKALEIDTANKTIDLKIKTLKTINDFENKNRIEQIKLQKEFLREQLKNENINAAQRAAITRRLVNIDKKEKLSKFETARESFGQLASLTQTNDKKLFEIGKKFAIAKAILDGFLAITTAFGRGGFPLAAATTVAVAVNLDRIRRSKPPSFQEGVTKVPPGFPNDSFNARLTSGERVVTGPQNVDLTNFLKREEKNGNKEMIELLKLIAQEIAATNTRLDNLENQTIVNIGNKEIINEVRTGLREGRSLAV